MTSELRECPILRGVGKINGDGWKDTTKKGEVVFVWNVEIPAPCSPGQFPRVGCEGWSASVEQYDFAPATSSDCEAIIAAWNTRQRTPDMDGVEELAKHARAALRKLRSYIGVCDGDKELDEVIVELDTALAFRSLYRPTDEAEGLRHDDYAPGGLFELASRCVTAVEQATASSSTTKAKIVANILRSFAAEKAAMADALVLENSDYTEQLAHLDGSNATQADTRCHSCGRDNPPWFADKDLWNLVMGGPEAADDPGGVLCASCFIEKSGETLRVCRATQADTDNAAPLTSKIAFLRQAADRIRKRDGDAASYLDEAIDALISVGAAQ